MYEDPRDMFGEMDEIFNRIFTRMNRDFLKGVPQVYGYHIVMHNGDFEGMPETPAITQRANSEPVAEVHCIGDEVKVITELPGTTKDLIDLDVQESRLIIDAKGPQNHYHTTADLPPVDVASMHTSFKNGVLEVTFGLLPGPSENRQD